VRPNATGRPDLPDGRGTPDPGPTGPATPDGGPATIDVSTHAWTPRHWLVLGAGLVAALAIRAILLPTPGLAGDLNEFAGWIHAIATEPFGRAYDRNLTFPPVMVYVWELIAALDGRFATVSDASDPGVRVVLKLAPTIADLGLAAGIGWLVRDRPWLAVGGALAILLHPAVIDLSAGFGQYESIYTLFGLLALILALGGRSGWAAVALGVALMTKPQALPFLVPFGAFFLAREGWLGAIRLGAIGAATIALLWLPFVPAGGPGNYLASIEYHQNELYNVLSLRAWNVWTLFQERVAAGQFLDDQVRLVGPLTARHLGYVMAGLLEFVVLRAVLRRPTARSLALGLAAAALVAFTFLTTMHERYAFAAIAFLLVAALVARERALGWLWVAFGVVFTLNLLTAIPPTPGFEAVLPFKGVVSIVGSIAMIAITTLTLVLLVRDPADRGGGDGGAAPAPARPSPPDTSGGSSGATPGA
jgi:dolichyl-phosphate-mannose-protein mannosyltransferase